MSDLDRPEVRPFWQAKRLDEMTEAEWDSLCDGCGRCCLEHATADDSKKLYAMDVGCELLDPKTAACNDYLNRQTHVPGCIKLNTNNIRDLMWLPPTCGYRRVFLGEKLEWWHPLVSGDRTTVEKAGVSAAGRFIRPDQAGPREYHTVEWPRQYVTSNQAHRWQTSLFGGVNASVPTPFNANSQVSLDIMSQHCLWLLANGCHGLAVLDHAGEVASLTIAERIAVLEGLIARGVPASKMLTGIGPAAAPDAQTIIDVAQHLGIRGVLLTATVGGRVMPHEVFATSLMDRIRQIGNSLFVYISLSVAPSATTACLTALENLMTHLPNTLRGLRDEQPGCTFGLAALSHIKNPRFEVYTADDSMLAQLATRGGAGVISVGANLFGRLERGLLEAPGTAAATLQQRAIGNGAKLLRSRPTVPAIKSLIARNSAQSSWARVRLPLRPPAAAERASLFRAFDATGIQLR